MSAGIECDGPMGGHDIDSVDPRPLVSILILTWNRRQEVERAIESAVGQAYPRTEVVVVDNGSSDGTPEFIADRFPGVRLIALSDNVGCPSGRNIGFRHCAGKYIYQLDDDGWLASDAVAVAVARAELDPAIAVVMSRIHEWEGDRVVRKRPLGIEQAVFLPHFSGGCSMIRRDVIERLGAYPDDFFRQGEESDLALRLLDHGYLCAFEPSSVMFHRPSALGRSTKLSLYYTLRNTNKTGLRLWPMPWCWLRPIVNMWHAVRGAVTWGYWALPVLVLRELVKDVAALHATRAPVSRRAYRTYRELQARPSSTVMIRGEIHILGPVATVHSGA